MFNFHRPKALVMDGTGIIWDRAMERSDNRKGALVIRTRFGEMSAECGVNCTKTLQEMIEDTVWLDAIGAESGPFCYTDFERSIPF